MPSGSLLAVAALAGQAGPLPGVTVTVLDESGLPAARLVTDENGRTAEADLPAPDRAYSLAEDNTAVRPYAVYTLLAEKDGWQPVEIRGVQVFDGQQTVARLALLPADPVLQTARLLAGSQVEIPPHPLYAGAGGSGPAPVYECAAPQVLDEVVIPRTITVHLGRPAENARNVTVPFQEYIANVASSEVYPTWPEQALRANILAQISLALNRIWTEWYPSRGYSFNITGSPAVDQAYTEGRTVFAVMERLTAELFATYVRRSGNAEPYFTEYCDGRLVSCAGMKQWGTVDRANEGMSALQILRYYYGSRVNLVTSRNLADIPESYPGRALRRGDSGAAVRVLQRQLDRIAKDYPAFGKPAATGVFDEATETSVRAFQRYFSLTVDGVVGRATWNKVSYIYVSVKELAQLTSEGEELGGEVSSGPWPGVVLRLGDEGLAVQVLQFWLADLALYDSSLPAVTVDGVYGAATRRAVAAFQQKAGLTADGVVGQLTWEALYAAWRNLQSDLGGGAYPGSALRRGSRGNAVRLVQFRLRLAAANYAAVPAVAVDGVYGAGTEAAVAAFQARFGLAEDGVTGRASWEALAGVGLAVVNGLVEPEEAPGQFPGTMRPGSTGTGVRALQFYLWLLAAYYADLPGLAVDGVYGADTEAAVTAWQQQAGLTADGVAGPATWQSVYTAAARMAASGPVARLSPLPAPAGALGPGDEGAGVAVLGQVLDFLAHWLREVSPSGGGDRFTPEMEASVQAAQAVLGLPVTGRVAAGDWRTLTGAASALYAVTPGTAAPRPEGIWPGYTLAAGSAGTAVLSVQQWLNALGGVDCRFDFVPETGFLDAPTLAALETYQAAAGLSPAGVVDDEVWRRLSADAAPYLPEGGQCDGETVCV